MDDLLSLDIWVRILLCFFRSSEIVNYFLAFKDNIVLFLLLYLQKVDEHLTNHATINPMNAQIVSANLKNNLIECLSEMCRFEAVRRLLFYHATQQQWIYSTLAGVTIIFVLSLCTFYTIQHNTSQHSHLNCRTSAVTCCTSTSSSCSAICANLLSFRSSMHN